MEKSLLLKAQLRTDKGSKAAEKIRKQGLVPAVVYGHKLDSVAITLDEHDFVESLHHGHRIMDVDIDGKKQTVMVKDLQYDYLGRKIIHADLIRVDVTETVKVTVPLELKGTAKGANEGGVIEEHSDHVEVECMVNNIPESIIVSVKEIGVGDNLHAGDIELPAGVKLASDPEMLILTCGLVAAAKSTEELEEEAPSAPEVIGKGKAEDGSEEENAE